MRQQNPCSPLIWHMAHPLRVDRQASELKNPRSFKKPAKTQGQQASK